MRAWHNRLGSWTTGLFAAVLSAMSAASVQAESVTWKMHAAAVDTRVEIQDTKWFADRVGELTGGAFTIELYAGGSLGIKDADLLRTLPGGTVVQAALMYPGYLAREAPEYALTLPPGVVGKPSVVGELLPTLRDIYQRTYDEAGIELVGFIGHAAAKTHIFCRDPINSLAGLKAKKVRVWEPFQIETFEKLDVAAQVIGQNDLYVAMSTGVVDCAVYPAAFVSTISLQEVAPNGSYLFPFVLHPLNIIVSRSAHDALSDAHKDALRQAAEEATARSFEAYAAAKYDAEAEAKLGAGDANLMPDYSDADRAAFAEAARAVWKGKAEEMGGQALEDYEQISKAIDAR